MITLLGKQELPEAAALCALAMADNPIHIRVFGPSDHLRQRRLSRFFPGLLAYIHRKGCLYGVVVDGALVGVLGLLPPGSCRPPFRFWTLQAG